jgi:hypothetical protein
MVRLLSACWFYVCCTQYFHLSGIGSSKITYECVEPITNSKI